MDARANSALKRLPGALDVLSAGTRKAGNDRPPNASGDALHGREISVRGDGETRLDDIHAQTVELARQTQLLLHVHAATRRLLAIAQSSVEYRDTRSFHAQAPPPGIGASMLRRQGNKAKLIILLLSLEILT